LSILILTDLNPDRLTLPTNIRTFASLGITPLHPFGKNSKSYQFQSQPLPIKTDYFNRTFASLGFAPLNPFGKSTLGIHHLNSSHLPKNPGFIPVQILTLISVQIKIDTAIAIATSYFLASLRSAIEASLKGGGRGGGGF
jgi:hypothetical protein